ncbi:hypothetical protein AAFC00_002407 [Neodothiora populina]|uniref:MICOS complex subunit MIC60 n=1 Tax=Neodothiora populina TaxID=2781224 RepID=A0ABR3P6Z6_9PEZI
MLRTRLVRSGATSAVTARLCAPAVYSSTSAPSFLVQSQWSPRSARTFADVKKPADDAVLPGAADVPPPTTDPAATPVGVQPMPRAPPTPEAVGATPPPPPPPSSATSSPSTNMGNLPPLGTGTAAVAPGQGSPRPKPRRFRRFLATFLILSSLGYAGGVYYSLVSDNFHDFFTEYVPMGEEAVAYFEEREFRKRFPTRFQRNKYPQIRGENKVTIGKSSGVVSKPSEELSNDKGPHVSAVTENNREFAKQTPSQATGAEKTQAVQEAKKESAKAPNAAAQKKAEVKTVESPPAAPVSTGPASSLVDNLSQPNAAEPVVQDVIQMLNDIITVVNNDANSSKYESTISQAKSQVTKIVEDIATLKARIEKEAQDQINNAHADFDTAAHELVRRLQGEMKEQETHWRDEYETEREKLSQGYQNKLAAELDVVRKVAEQRVQNALIEQEIALQRKFAQSVKDRVEQERAGRLSKLDELSSSVAELEKLTGDWNKVVDANLKTQHLHIALDAVRNAVNKYDHPTPFVNELAALKEISSNNDVVNAAIASIPPTAYQRGIPTPAHLIERFRRVASEVRKASLLPEEAGIASHAASAVLSRFMFQKQGTGVPDGDDVEAVLTRTQVSLEEGDLDGAAREMNSLHGWAGVLSRDWVAECRRVLEVKQALDVIATEARLQSLLAD